MKATDRITGVDLHLPTEEQLNAPGGPERLLNEIATRVDTLDTRYRAYLDAEVAKCVQVAHFFLRNIDRASVFFQGAFLEHYQRHGRRDAEALRFVLRKVFEQKKASKILNAIKHLFTEGVSAAELPARVRAAGGYERLAAENSRSRKSRPKPKPHPSGSRRNAREQLTLTGLQAQQLKQLPLPCAVMVGIELLRKSGDGLVGRVHLVQLLD